MKTEITQEHYRDASVAFTGWTLEGKEPIFFATEPTSINGWFGWIVYLKEGEKFYQSFSIGAERPKTIDYSMKVKFEQPVRDEQMNFAAYLASQCKETPYGIPYMMDKVRENLPKGFTCGRGASHIWIHETDEQGNTKPERWAIITE